MDKLGNKLHSIEEKLGGQEVAPNVQDKLGWHLDYIEDLIEGGSSGGNVDDVKVNDTSVVEDKVANIKLKTIEGESIVGEGNISIPTPVKLYRHEISSVWFYLTFICDEPTSFASYVNFAKYLREHNLTNLRCIPRYQYDNTNGIRFYTNIEIFPTSSNELYIRRDVNNQTQFVTISLNNDISYVVYNSSTQGNLRVSSIDDDVYPIN